MERTYALDGKAFACTRRTLSDWRLLKEGQFFRAPLSVDTTRHWDAQRRRGLRVGILVRLVAYRLKDDFGLCNGERRGWEGVYKGIALLFLVNLPIAIDVIVGKESE